MGAGVGAAWVGDGVGDGDGRGVGSEVVGVAVGAGVGSVVVGPKLGSDDNGDPRAELGTVVVGAWVGDGVGADVIGAGVGDIDGPEVEGAGVGDGDGSEVDGADDSGPAVGGAVSRTRQHVPAQKLDAHASSQVAPSVIWEQAPAPNWSATWLQTSSVSAAVTSTVAKKTSACAAIVSRGVRAPGCRALARPKRAMRRGTRGRRAVKLFERTGFEGFGIKRQTILTAL